MYCLFDTWSSFDFVNDNIVCFNKSMVILTKELFKLGFFFKLCRECLGNIFHFLFLFPLLSFLTHFYFLSLFISPSDVIKYQENVAVSPPSCDLSRIEDDNDDDAGAIEELSDQLAHNQCSEGPKFTAGRKNVIFNNLFLMTHGSYKEKFFFCSFGYFQP